MLLSPHANPALRLRANVASPVIISSVTVRSSCRVVVAVTVGGRLGARVGNGGWNEGDEENADDSEPVTQAEGGDTECDEGDENECCRDSGGIEACGDDPCSSYDGVGLCWGERTADEREGEHAPSLPSGCR